MARAGTSVALCAVMLMATFASPAHADDRLTSLLAALDLRAYAAATRPPEFSGRTIRDDEVSLEKLRGKVVIVNFWASWCAECRPEMPVLERLHRERAEQGLVVIGVNARENTETVRRYAKELGLSFPLVVDAAGTINTLYGVIGLPTTFVIGRDGRAVALGVGAREWASPPARSLIALLLTEPAPPSERR